MKKFLLAGAAFALLSSAAGAADLPRAMAKAPIAAAAPYAQPFFSWTGGYVGLFGGYGFSGDDTKVSVGGAPLVTGLKPEGGFFGAELGYDYQFAPNWVIGIAGDAALSDINDSKTIAAIGGYSVGAGSKLDKFGTVRGKLGYAIDRVLVYGTGGLAVGYNEATANIRYPGGSVSAFDSQTHVGWTAGAGLDWAFTNTLSWKTEYLYADFGKKSYFSNVGLGSVEVHPTTHIVKSGIDFKFSAF
ncbi:outer membrane immunogenic protein [Bradyrhizobium sp. USDA 4341]